MSSNPLRYLPFKVELVPSLWVWARLSDSYLLMKKMWQKWGWRRYGLGHRGWCSFLLGCSAAEPYQCAARKPSSHVPRSHVPALVAHPHKVPANRQHQSADTGVKSTFTGFSAQALSTSTDTVWHGNKRPTKPAWIADSWKI